MSNVSNELEKEVKTILEKADQVLKEISCIEVLHDLREQYVRNEITADEYLNRVGILLDIDDKISNNKKENKESFNPYYNAMS